MSIKIDPGTKELARERKFVREILKLVMDELMGEYKLVRDEERYGNYIDGYYARYHLINSKKRDRIQRNMNFWISTCGNYYLLNNKSERIILGITGSVNFEVTKPKQFSKSRSVKSVERTFDRERKKQHIANAVIKMIYKVEPEFYDIVDKLSQELESWDKFADKINRVKKRFKIPEEQMWRQASHSHQVEMRIPGKDSNITNVGMTTEVFSDKFILHLNGVSEDQLSQIMNIVHQ